MTPLPFSQGAIEPHTIRQVPVDVPHAAMLHGMHIDEYAEYFWLIGVIRRHPLDEDEVIGNIGSDLYNAPPQIAVPKNLIYGPVLASAYHALPRVQDAPPFVPFVRPFMVQAGDVVTVLFALRGSPAARPGFHGWFAAARPNSDDRMRDGIDRAMEQESVARTSPDVFDKVAMDARLARDRGRTHIRIRMDEVYAMLAYAGFDTERLVRDTEQESVHPKVAASIADLRALALARPDLSDELHDIIGQLRDTEEKSGKSIHQLVGGVARRPTT